MASKNYPCEVRLYMTDEMHSWIKNSAKEQGLSVQAFSRSVFLDAMERSKLKKQHGVSGHLVDEVTRKVIAELASKQGGKSTT